MHRGPLHYAYDISRSETVLARNSQEPRAVDLQLDAAGPWQYAIDPSTLTFHGRTPTGGKLPSPVFDSGLPPFTITAVACQIEWAVAGDTFAAAPPTEPACVGPATNITLWPFGVSSCTFGSPSLVRLGRVPSLTVIGCTGNRRRSFVSASSRRSRRPERNCCQPTSVRRCCAQYGASDSSVDGSWMRGRRAEHGRTWRRSLGVYQRGVRLDVCTNASVSAG